MIRFHAEVSFVRPGLHVWIPGTPLKANLLPVEHAADGVWRFDAHLDDRSAPSVRALLYDRDEVSGEPLVWEGDGHQREVGRRADGTFPYAVWLFQEASRVVTDEPGPAAGRLRIHLLTARRYRDGRLYLWRPGRPGRLVDRSEVEGGGPYWDLDLDDGDRSPFLFKFVEASGAFEPSYANRLYVASDGPEVWTHSRAPGVVGDRPVKRRLRVHLRQELAEAGPPLMHVWQESSDFVVDIPAVEAPDGWFRAEVDLYERLPYGVLFHDPSLGADQEWEHREAARAVAMSGDTDVWTIEGDPRTFAERPRPDRPVTIEMSAVAPWAALDPPLRAEVLVNHARAPLRSIEIDGGHGSDASAPPTIRFLTYPEVTTTVRLLSLGGPVAHEESRHRVVVPAGGEVTGFVVGGIGAVLNERPPADPFADAPFPIERPGAYEREGEIRFALHAPAVARARVVGEWTGWEQRPLEMSLTRDGTYWWARVPTVEVNGGDYHGVAYRFLLDDGRPVQDPAAGWVEASAVDASSRLVRHSAFAWTDQAWETPGFDHLLLYQLHPSRFSDRHPGLAPLDRIAREVEGGWLA